MPPVGASCLAPHAAMDLASQRAGPSWAAPAAPRQRSQVPEPAEPSQAHTFTAELNRASWSERDQLAEMLLLVRVQFCFFWGGSRQSAALT